MSLIGEGMEILSLVNKAQNADLYKDLGSWIEKVLSLQLQVDELTAERNNLREQLRFKGTLERINRHAFVQGDDEEICPRCADVDRRPVHLVARWWMGMMQSVCPQCKLELSEPPQSRQGPGAN